MSQRIQRFVQYLNDSPSPFHCVESSQRILEAAGFTQLHENGSWTGAIKAGGKYYFMRNQSTIFAFAVGGKYAVGNGVNIVAAHTDSPNLRVKPKSAKESVGYMTVGVECYGGGLWHTWFDRDLSVAGRVLVAAKDGTTEGRLVRINRPILRVPNLAIHLTGANEREAFQYNKESHLGNPVLATRIQDDLNAPARGAISSEQHHSGFLAVLAKEMGISADQICDMELSLYDTMPSAVGGLHEEFIFSPRLDNQAMSFCGLEGLVTSLAKDSSLAEDPRIRMVALFDHEEIGSSSAQGAASNMMESTIRRIADAFDAQAAPDDHYRNYRNSFLISADMAHAVHPNYVAKHEDRHRPMMHKGVVIKHNANQRYATTSATAYLLKQVAAEAKQVLQEFVVRNDSPCGSTIGPILSSRCGMRTIDIGAPQLSMHSIREMCATSDIDSACELFDVFFRRFAAIDEKVVGI